MAVSSASVATAATATAATAATATAATAATETVTADAAVVGQSSSISPNPFVVWLQNEGWEITEPAELIGKLANAMVQSGIPLMRVRVTIRTLHPQVIGNIYTWNRDTGEVEEFSPPHSVAESEAFQNSPFVAIFEGAGAIRRRLDIPDATLDYSILEDLRAKGATDYVALPLVFSDGQINVITVASDQPGGFTAAELKRMYETLPVLSRRLEMYAMRHTARTLLDTYLGKNTGERVLNGNIKRGDGEDIHAVIWFCDLRDSTALADSMPRQEFLGLLNDFFDCMAGPVLDHGGEVLRFIGDAALAIFPTSVSSAGIDRGCCTNEQACGNALDAALDARARMAALNQQRVADGKPALGFGLGLHMGDLTYGNIGVPGRLEFTVVGAAANEAARIEGLTKSLGHPILVSAEFAQCHPKDLVSLGKHPLRGVGEVREIFALDK